MQSETPEKIWATNTSHQILSNNYTPEIKWVQKLMFMIIQWMWCSVTQITNLPKNEISLSSWGSVSTFPEAFGCFLARLSMCHVQICSQAAHSQSSCISCQSATQNGTSRPSVSSWLFSGFGSVFSILPDNMLVTFDLVLEAQK